MNNILAYLHWDPAREMFNFNLPLINRPILWYGFFFALGFFLGYWILLDLLKRSLPGSLRTLSKQIAEKLTVYVVIGSVVGARLGDVLFYQNLSDYVDNPLDILMIWKGGLASHGAALGVLIALTIFRSRNKKTYPELIWLKVLDLLVIPAALAGAFIRIGNFFNQEILGKVTDVPWAIIFMHPVDGSPVLPRHPVQLYESVYYFFVFIVLYSLWRTKPKMRVSGKTSGLFLLLVFGFRFFIEFFKLEQSELLSDAAWLDMGQWLSIPFILLGIFLLFRKKK